MNSRTKLEPVDTGAFFQQSISRTIWETTFRWQDETEYETQARIAKAVSSTETSQKKQTMWYDEYYDLLVSRKLTPAGRIVSNAGTGLSGATMCNCYVSGFSGSDQDSMESIYTELGRQARILKSEGGYGINFGTLRPGGSLIRGIGVTSPGPIAFMKLWNQSSRAITSGSGAPGKENGKKRIRKGAMMGILPVWHPDIESFITAKSRSDNGLELFNISVLVSDEFMRAVEKDLPWQTEFPDTSFERYKAEWDGNLGRWKEKGYPVDSSYPSYSSARILWNLIMKSVYDRAEPGILFEDTINRWNNLGQIEYIKATNPCVTLDTFVMTKDGPKQVFDIISQPFDCVVNGISNQSTEQGFFFTGNKQVFQVFTEEGYTSSVTENEQFLVQRNDDIAGQEQMAWVPLDQLCAGDKLALNNHKDISEWSGNYKEEDGYLVGLLLGDGTLKKDKAVISVWLDKEQAGDLYINNSIIRTAVECALRLSYRSDFKGFIPVKGRKEYRMALSSVKAICLSLGMTSGNKKITPELEKCSYSFYRGFLRGMFDSVGYVQHGHEKGAGVRLSQSDYNTLVAIQRMLLRMGISSKIHPYRRKAGKSLLPSGRRGNRRHNTKAQHELCISGDSVVVFSEKIGFADDKKSDALRKLVHSYSRIPYKSNFYATFLSAISIGHHDVYDCQIPGINRFDGNGFILHNCGEQPLPTNGACVLSSLVLPSFVSNGKFDYDSFMKSVQKSIRFLDSVIDASVFPLDEQYLEVQSKRRIGLGITGFGSMLYLMKIRYGSRQAIELANKIMSVMANMAYHTSAVLAREKGKFPLYDESRISESPFINKVLSPEVRDIISEFGLRNSHLLSIAPTGTISMYANYVSSGIEPIYRHVQHRTVVVHENPEGLAIPEVSDWDRQISSADTQVWKWRKEGDVNLLVTRYRGTIYKLYRDRGLTFEEPMYDYAVRLLGEDFDPSADWAVTVADVTVDEHLAMLRVFSKWVDSAISKTINVPNDYPFESFAGMYLDAWKSGTIKGVTSYREGTMAAVISSTATSLEDDRSRPDTMPCNVHRIRVKGEPWIVFVGLHRGKPYEVFAGHDKENSIPEDVKDGVMIRRRSGIYSFEKEGKVLIENITSIFENKANEKDTRMLSTLLRNGVDPAEIVEQLRKCPSTIVDFERSIIKALTVYVKDGTKGGTCAACGATLVYSNGCCVCPECGSAACG